MKISELLKKEAVKLNTSASDKNDAIDQLIELHYTAGNVTDKAVFKKAILAREEEGTTGMENGIAIPHAVGGGFGNKKPGKQVFQRLFRLDFVVQDKPFHNVAQFPNVSRPAVGKQFRRAVGFEGLFIERFAPPLRQPFA